VMPIWRWLQSHDNFLCALQEPPVDDVAESVQGVEEALGVLIVFVLTRPVDAGCRVM
jgi:hypothetical protein